MYVATIDTGTTNTRVKIWQKGKLLAFSHVSVGVRDTGITGNKDKLKKGVKDAIEKVLTEVKIESVDVGLYLASGMITSNVGLYEVPHVFAPAGITDLAKHMVSTTLPEIVDQSIWFVPGVKNDVRDVTLENFATMDIMRGEEVETFGLLAHLNMKGPALLILPGSHSKFVRVDQQGRIIGCITTLGGEMLSVLTTETILASSLGKSFAESIDTKMAQLGAESVQKFGLTRSCFMVRILDQFAGSTLNEKANFLAGAIVSNDLLAIKASKILGDCQNIPVIIGGSNSLSGIFEVLVQQDEYFGGELTTVSSEVMKDKAGYGAILVARERGICP